MVIKNLLVPVIGLFLFESAHAHNKDPHLETKSSFSDSTGIDDSLKQGVAVSDSKQEFRKLFASPSSSDMDKQKLRPQIISYVENYAGKYGKKLEGIRDRSKRYLDIIDDILEEYGLPGELKYLAVIESDLKTNARSAAGALGPWQLMPETARNMGLRVNKNYDERRDFTKSTRAACKYLAGLYTLYNDWILVIAAYNSGPGKVNAAIKRSGSRDFWILQKYLPAESQGHVKRFIATRYFMEGLAGDAIAAKNDLKNNNSNNPSLEDSVIFRTESISGRYNSSVIVRHILMDIVVFNKMNPDFDKLVGDNGTYQLQLPPDKMELFLSRKSEILNESMQLLLNPAHGPAF